MKIKLLLTLSIFGLLWSCSKEDPIIDPIQEKALILSDLKAGQTSTYLRYQTTCEDPAGTFEYTGDTLIVTVTEVMGQLYLEEKLTDGSPLIGLDDVKQINTHIVHADGERILIPERFNSPLFFFFGNDTLPVMAEVNRNLQQEGCKLYIEENPFIGNEIGKVERFEVGDIVQTDKRSVSCVPYFTLDAYLIYDNKKLYQSHTIRFEEFNGQILNDLIEGWVLLE